jgi:hypothetical protein
MTTITHWPGRTLRPALSVLLLLGLAGAAFAGAPLWSHKSSREIKWHKLTAVGTLLVGTDDAVTCFDPETGKPAWTRADLKKVSEDRVEEIAGRPLLLVSPNEGPFQSKTKLLALDVTTGQTLWETEKLKGATVEIYPVYEREMAVIFTVVSSSTNKDKPDMIAVDMVDGKVLWESELPEKVDLHGLERGGRFFPRFDLSGHQPPMHDGDSLYVTYAGLHRFDLATGKLVWKAPYDVTEGGLKRGNAQAVIDGDTIYTSAKGQLRAIDKATGAVKWASKDFGAAVAEMAVRGGVIYGRMGGHFYDANKREWVLKKPLGVVTVDRRSGATIARYDKLKESVTNLAFVDAQKTLLIADAENLIGLEINDAGSLKEAYRVKLEFKRKLGAGDVAMTAARIGFGGLRGLAARPKNSGDDYPVNVSLRETGVAVVRGKQHLLAFDPRSRQIAWSVQYEAPGVPGWQKMAMLAITAVNYMGATANAASTQLGTSENNRWNNQRAQSLANYQSFMRKRFSATQATGQYVYILTTVEEGKDKGAGLVGVNLNTGETSGQVMLKDKEPDYQVDEATGRVFNVKDRSSLMVYGLK